MASAYRLHHRAARVLPEVIKTSGVLIEENGQRELAAMLFALRRKSNGAMLYRLSPATVEAMAHSPLEYLAGATRSRQSFPCQEPLEYHPWRAARIPKRWIQRAWQDCAGSACASVLACFTTSKHNNAVVIVVPEARLVAYLWRD